jgi:outer membrane protein OmpA-like peptidoglycan-associated protein
VTEAAPEPAPEPMPEPEPAVEPAPAAEEQTASLPPSSEIAPGQVRIAFPEGSTEIPADAIPELDALAGSLLADEASRIQLLAYASGAEDAASRARRISLSRALAVRSYLIGKGVRSTRMDVRALGNTVPGDPADRVDIIPQS